MSTVHWVGRFPGTSLKCPPLHYTLLYFTTHLCTSVNCSTFHHKSLPCTILQFTDLNWKVTHSWHQTTGSSINSGILTSHILDTASGSQKCMFSNHIPCLVLLCTRKHFTDYLGKLIIKSLYNLLFNCLVPVWTNA